METKIDIGQLSIKEKEKDLLFRLSNNYMTTAEIGAFLDCTYITASQKVMIWFAKKWLIRSVDRGRARTYTLNKVMFDI